MFSNTSTGAAVEGASASGTGLFGTSSSGVYYQPGVDGESSDPDGEDAAGAFGLNVMATGVAPQYGVLAYGNGIGLAGEENSAGTSYSNSVYGVFGQDSTGTDSASGDFNVGVVGASTVGTGVLGESNGGTADLVFGAEPIGVYAVANPASNEAFAILGQTSSQNGTATGLALTDEYTGATLLALQSGDQSRPGEFLYGRSGASAAVIIDYDGDETLRGSLTTSKSTYVRSTDATGTTRLEYGDRTTAPQVEDVGEAQLTAGRASVNIDRDLANTIDQRAAYHVFVTPEGDCNGLFVTQKSATGFTVRELRGGRSSLAFEYRIVAKPRGENGARLAIAPPLKSLDLGLGSRGKSHANSLPPLSPQERLKRRMGTQAYAQAMLRFRASRLSAR